MALLIEATESKKLDVRMIERNIDRGVLKPDDLKQAVQALPDDSENAEWISIAAIMNDTSEQISNGRASH